MSTENRPFEQRFFLDADPSICVMPEDPKKLLRKTWPEHLYYSQKLEKRSWRKQKRIYLSASEKFPESCYLAEQEGSDIADLTCNCLIGERQGGGKNAPARAFETPVDRLLREFLLEQTRAHLDRKMLPSFTIYSMVFNGNSNLPCTITCESVTQGPKVMNGSYLTIQPWAGRGSNELRAQRCMESLFGSMKVKQTQPLRRTLEEMLEKANPKFRWHYSYTRHFTD